MARAELSVFSMCSVVRTITNHEHTENTEWREEEPEQNLTVPTVAQI